jgi:hypothetical protein
VVVAQKLAKILPSNGFFSENLKTLHVDFWSLLFVVGLVEPNGLLCSFCADCYSISSPCGLAIMGILKRQLHQNLTMPRIEVEIAPPLQ